MNDADKLFRYIKVEQQIAYALVLISENNLGYYDRTKDLLDCIQEEISGLEKRLNKLGE